jgi:hypothetical protein
MKNIANENKLKVIRNKIKIFISIVYFVWRVLFEHIRINIFKYEREESLFIIDSLNEYFGQAW